MTTNLMYIQVQEVPLALLGHQVNWLNYYHVFVETLPTWHNIACRYLQLCTYDAHSSLQIWTLEDRGPAAFSDVFANVPALEPLYACLTPHSMHHIREAEHVGKVCTCSSVDISRACCTARHRRC